MKKIILLTLLITSLYSDGTIYIGTSAGYYSENFSNLDAKSSSNMGTVKIGYGDMKAYAVEFSVDYLINDSNIFSSEGVDGNKKGFNLELVKAYNFNKYFYPYIKAGFGSGYMSIKRSIQSKLSYGSFNLGAGIFVPIINHIDLEFSYLYKDVSYEGVDLIASKKSYKSKINSASLGINIRF
ncbi:outer membrane protein [Sulfurimonas sp.]